MQAMQVAKPLRQQAVVKQCIGWDTFAMDRVSPQGVAFSTSAAQSLVPPWYTATEPEPEPETEVTFPALNPVVDSGEIGSVSGCTQTDALNPQCPVVNLNTDIYDSCLRIFYKG